MGGKTVRKTEPAQTLLKLVEDTPSGSQIVLDDLTDYCISISELGEAVLLAYKKNIKIKAKSPSWFDMNGIHENPMITVVKMYNLQCELDKRYKSDVNLLDD